jgi:hypothetical protein
MLTPATINVEFIANYAGQHRVCWRVQNLITPGTYACTNIVTCVGGGNMCSTIVSVMVDPESCDPVIFEGYIQATCNVEGSLIDRVPFEVIYTPTPTCTGYRLTNTTDLVADLSSADLGLNCNGTVRPATQLVAGQVINLCGISNMPTGIVIDYDVTPTNLCCYTCNTYRITGVVTGAMPVGTLYYINCTTREFTVLPITGASLPLDICMVKDSLTYAVNDLVLTITDIGSC